MYSFNAMASALNKVEHRMINYSRYDLYEGDMRPKVFKSKCKKMLRNLQLSAEKIELLERMTVGQSDNQRWIFERNKRLTASNFGRVFMWDEETCRASTLIESIISPSPSIAQRRAMNYGRRNEGNAIAEYEYSTNRSVDQCGLFVHPEFGFLGASPDGLVGRNGILEVKCPRSARRMTPLDAARRLQNFCCYEAIDGKMYLRDDHEYYFQIQGQLEITGKKFCDFVIWTPHGINIERIYRDDWLFNEMFPKLEEFYKLYLLPELVDPRLDDRDLPIRVLEFYD